MTLSIWGNPVDRGRKLNVHKTFRRRPGSLLKVLCTFNLRPVSTGNIDVDDDADEGLLGWSIQ